MKTMRLTQIIDIRKNPLMKVVAILMLFICCVMSLSYGQDVKSAPSAIRTPEELAMWFSTEFRYELKFPDNPQSPTETMELKTGDCDDFAKLAHEILSKNGIKGDVVTIKFQDLKIMHAIFIWKDENGTHSFISNQELFHTDESDLATAVHKSYPGCEKITFLDENGEPLKTIAI